jgi:hypothetical protein
VFWKKSVTRQLNARREEQRAEYARAWALADGSRTRAFQISAGQPGSLAAQLARAQADKAERQRAGVQARFIAEDTRQLATLGAPRGVLHRLLREYDREERRGQHDVQPARSGRERAPAEAWLSRMWDSVRSTHPGLFRGGEPDPAAIMGAIGARPGDTAARGWVERCLGEDRAFDERIEAEYRAEHDCHDVTRERPGPGLRESGIVPAGDREAGQ